MPDSHHFNASLVNETESAIPLLSLRLETDSANMSADSAIEKSHGAAVTVGKLQSHPKHLKNPYRETEIAYEDEEVAANQGRLRRLFSFVQLLAFALTFMSSWEVIAM